MPLCKCFKTFHPKNTCRRTYWTSSATLESILEFFTRTDIHHPWAATSDDEKEINPGGHLVLHTDTPQKHQGELIRLLGKNGQAQMNFMDYIDAVMKGIVPLEMPGDGNFNYPADKKRIKQNHDTMRATGTNLDFFWS